MVKISYRFKIEGLLSGEDDKRTGRWIVLEWLQEYCLREGAQHSLSTRRRREISLGLAVVKQKWIQPCGAICHKGRFVVVASVLGF